MFVRTFAIFLHWPTNTSSWSLSEFLCWDNQQLLQVVKSILDDSWDLILSLVGSFKCLWDWTFQVETWFFRFFFLPWSSASVLGKWEPWHHPMSNGSLSLCPLTQDAASTNSWNWRNLWQKDQILKAHGLQRSQSILTAQLRSPVLVRMQGPLFQVCLTCRKAHKGDSSWPLNT